MKEEYHRIRLAGIEITVNIICTYEKHYLVEIKDYMGEHSFNILKTEFEQRKVRREIQNKSHSSLNRRKKIKS